MANPDPKPAVERWWCNVSHYCPNGHRPGDRIEVVRASDYDAAIAERDALRAKLAYEKKQVEVERQERHRVEDQRDALRARVAELAGELAATRFAFDERAVAEASEVEARIARGVTVPFKPGDRIRLKANHAIEAVVDSVRSDGSGFFSFAGSTERHLVLRPDDWERVPQPMPTLEPGMVVEYDGSRLLGEMKDAVSIAYCFGTPEQRSRITRVGRVEWIWERDDAQP